MALSGKTLKGLIKTQLESLTEDNEEGQNYKGTVFSDAFIEAIAEAVVAHITTSAEVNITIPSYSAPPGGGSVTGSAKGKIT